MTETLLILPFAALLVLTGFLLFAHELDQLRCDQRSFQEAHQNLLESDGPIHTSSLRCRGAHSRTELKSLQALLEDGS